MEIKLKENERIDDLEINGMKIIQNTKGFCYGMDSVLLSDFAKEIRKKSKCVDLGTGTGILGILLCAKTEISEVVGIEIQEEVAEMAQRSIVLNNLEEKFKIEKVDIKGINSSKLKKGSFDCVITNPPYKKVNSGKINDNERKLISRHEIKATLSDFINAADYLLKEKGTLYMVHRPERMVDIFSELRDRKIEPKKVRFVHPHEKQEPNLILIKAVKNAQAFLRIEKPLYVYKKDGEYTDEILEIYGKKKS